MKTLTLVSMFGLLMGCQASAAVGTANTTSVEIRPSARLAPEAAIKEITGARCAKAVQCGDVSESGWKSVNACEGSVRRATRNDFISSQCTWVSAGQLSSCLDAIHGSDCTGPTTSVAGLESCRTMWMCR